MGIDKIYFEFFSIDPASIVGTILNLLILVLVVKHFLFDKVNAILEERKEEVAKTYEDADSTLKNAKRLQDEYQDRLAEAREESADIIRNAQRTAQKRSDDIIEGAKSEAQGIITRANSDIEKEKKRAVNQIKDEISGIAMSIAEKVVAKEIDSAAHEKLVEDFINEIGE